MRIFVNSWSDYFIQQSDPWREDAWDIIRKHPQHDWQILTKRPERILECLPPDWGDGWNHVWLGVSVENQKAADLRIPILASIPAKTRFLSVEPMIEKPDLKRKTPHLKNKIHWVIIGGESGNDKGKYRYRPCQLQWIRDVVAQCQDNAVPVFVKQIGTYLSKEMGLKDRHGGDITEWPEDIQVREFPIS